MVQGTEEVVLTLIFDVPPGLSGEQVKHKLAECVSVATGMLTIMRETHAEVRKRANVPTLVSQ